MIIMYSDRIAGTREHHILFTMISYFGLSQGAHNDEVNLGSTVLRNTVSIKTNHNNYSSLILIGCTYSRYVLLTNFHDQ